LQQEDVCTVVLNYWTDEEGERATISRLRRILRRLNLLNERIQAVLDDKTLDVVVDNELENGGAADAHKAKEDGEV
jgi:hypothetical protein